MSLRRRIESSRLFDIEVLLWLAVSLTMAQDLENPILATNYNKKVRILLPKQSQSH